ncbi:MAG: DUF47 domain-containing protein [Desulfurococcaceae archaeon]
MYSDRSLADLFIHENLLNLLEKGRDVVKAFIEVVDEFVKEGDVSKVYNKFLAPKLNVEEARLMFMEYIVRVGDVVNKEHYIKIALGIERLAQILEGALYRLLLVRKHNISIEQDSKNILVEFRVIIEEQYSTLWNCVRKLRENSKESLLGVNDIVKLENRADELYREATVSIYSKYAHNIFALMLFRDIIDFFEEAVDTLKNVGEEIRYLALYRTMIA